MRTTAEAMETGPAWGWDETMHAELPAVRMVLLAQDGQPVEAFEVLHECDRYPFVYPVCLAVWQGVFGVGEAQARALGVWTFLLLGLLAVARLARRVARQIDPTSRGVALDAALFAMLAAVSSPLARRYAPTIFLESTTLVFIAFALEAWLARRDAAGSGSGAARRNLVAGAWVALVFFTKFNYGLMLIAVIGLDGLVDLAVSRRRAATLRSHVIVALPLALASVWWFLLPLPLGSEMAASHRAAFLGFVTGNTEMGMMPMWLRAMAWLTGIAAHAFLFAAMVLACALPTLVWRSRVSVTLAIALAGFTLPVVLHNFQLDRFLLPSALAVWVSAAVGVAFWLDRRPRWLAAAAGVLCASCLLVSTFQTVQWAGFPAAEAGTPGRAYQEEYVGETLGVFGPPASPGLTRATHERLLDFIAEGVGPTARVGWLGQSSEMSPAALHLGLLARGGEARRFLADAQGPMDLDPIPHDAPGELTGEDALAFAGRFEHVVLVATGDLKRAKRNWIVDLWHRPVIESEDFSVQSLGTVFIERALAEPLAVEIRLASRR